MNWAFALLGVAVDADVSSVKRAYARLLRSTRPDEDADAFQRLHMAYQLVLAHANGRELRAAAQPVDAPRPALSGAPNDQATDETAFTPVAAPPPTAVVNHTATPSQPHPAGPEERTVVTANPQELVHRVIQYAVTASDDRVLSRWLSTLPELWSIQTKLQTGRLLLNQLFGDPKPMAPACLDTLLQFFDLQQVLSGVNPLALARLRERQLALWYLLPQNHRALALRLNVPTNRSADPKVLQACLRLLQAPWRWQSVPWTAILRGRSAAIARLIHGLCGGLIDDLPAQINRQSALFWYRAALTPAMSWPRFAVGTVRAVFVALMVLIGIVGVTALASAGRAVEFNWSGSLCVGSLMAASMLGLWLIYAGWIWLDHWQGLPEANGSGQPWLRRMLIPGLCATSLGLDYLAGQPVLSMFITMTTLILAVRRYYHRSAARPAKRRARIGSAIPGIGFLCIVLANAMSKLQSEIFDDIPLVAILATMTLCIWLSDMWRHRLHFKNMKTTA